MIPRQWVNNYTVGINVISKKAREALSALLAAIDMDQDVATVREQAVQAMQGVCGTSTQGAAMLSAQFYNGIRQYELGETIDATFESGREPEATEGAVRAFAQKLVDGKRDEFVGACLDRADYEVKVAAAQTCVNNAERDPRKPRFARVPSGEETCDFCLMLASRGFVYHTEVTASHAHANCDCRIIPSWESEEVEGYDPDELYRQWRNGKQSSAEHADGNTIKDIVYPNSVGADVFRDEVRIPRKVTGLSHDSFTQIARGSRISGRHKIAGAGTNTPIHSELDSLKEEYPEVERRDWEKWAGNGVVEDLGLERRAHLHWYWSEETGRVRMKVDHFLR